MPARAIAFAFELVLLGALVPSACHPAEEADSPEATPPPAAHEIAEWLLGEQVRGSKTRNRGINVGVVTLELTPNGPPTRTIRPGSCALDLVQLMPLRTGTWLAIDQSGQLLRHAGAGWSPLPSKPPLPPIGKLLASTGSAKRLELLVTIKDRPNELSLLTISEAQVTGIQSADLSTFQDRKRTLQRYDSGRCLDHVRDCLHLAAADQSLFLMREPELFANWEQLTELGKEVVLDARYADASGTKIDMLTAAACAPAPEVVVTPEPSAESEPAP